MGYKSAHFLPSSQLPSFSPQVSPPIPLPVIGSNPTPYILKYGDGWRTVISKTVGLSPFLSITSLVTYSIEKSTRIIKGTVYKYNWYLYHDVLSLMTAKTILTWIDDMGYKKDG